jgi:hypothetical protein
MDFCVRLDANHSDSPAIARIRNDAWRKKPRFYAHFVAKRPTSSAPYTPSPLVGYAQIFATFFRGQKYIEPAYLKSSSFPRRSESIGGWTKPSTFPW